MLLTIAEVAEKLRTTPGAARGVLDRLKVKPFNLGRGRGLGLRWKSEEIDAALDMSREPRQRPKPPPNIPQGSLFIGRSVAEIAAELTNTSRRQ